MNKSIFFKKGLFILPHLTRFLVRNVEQLVFFALVVVEMKPISDMPSMKI